MTPSNGPIDFKVAASILHTARDYLRQYGVSRDELARAIGTSESYVSTLFTEIDRNRLYSKESRIPAQTRDKLLRAINTWLEEDFRSRLARRPDNFVLTEAAKLIVGAARRIRAARTIGIVDGPAGVGKSLTAEFIVADELPGSMYIVIDDDCATVLGLRKKLYAICRLRRRATQRPSLEDIVERLKGTGRLLIIDQAHELQNERCFRLLMHVHDQCDRLPIMLLGTRAIHARLRDDEDPEFGQLSSRIGYRVHLLQMLMRAGSSGRQRQWVAVAELRRMFETGKLKLSTEAWRYLAQVANFEVGMLRRVRNVITLAEAVARGRGAIEISLAHVEAAIEMVEGEARRLMLPPAETEAAVVGGSV